MSTRGRGTSGHQRRSNFGASSQSHANSDQRAQKAYSGAPPACMNYNYVIAITDFVKGA